ncbi:alpha/beta hydrolase [beta proteobacterium AAP51]|nr:alpha/beta hydrolase [beta proteobacterium AAP51]
MTPPKSESPREGQAETLVAADGYRLTALRYRAGGPPQGRIVLAGATGVPQRFYRRFAQHAAAQGFETLTLDYRGIGLSRPAELRGFEMDYRDWARLDLAAAVDACPEDGVPLFMVGHSYGGHAFGLLPNHARVAGLYTFATGAGWHGWMPPLERLRVLLMWRVLGPVLTRWKGYLPWSLLGMGEDLPLGVYRQWRHWCQFPRYFFDDPELAAEVQAQFAAVRTPIVAANALDDHWAPPASRDAFMAGYRQAGWRALDIAPVAPLGPIGHMGYFRPAAQALWAPVLAWFSSLPAAASSTTSPGAPHAQP